MISCFRKKPENRRQNKLTLKLVWARKTQGLNMGWNGELWAGLGESIWIWTGNGERGCTWMGVDLKLVEVG